MLAFRGKYKEIVLFYVLTLLLAAWIAYPYILSGGPQAPGGDQPSTAGVLFIEILVATAIFLAIVRFFPWLFKWVLLGLEILFLFVSVFLLLTDISPALGIIGGIAAVVARLVYGNEDIVQNVSTALIVAVTIAIVAAGLSPIVTLLLLVILAIYDYISVFVTKHMVTLAKAVAGPGAKVGQGEKHLLGAGDVAIPGMFAISLARASPLASVLACVGAVLGLLFTTWLAKWWKRVLPALPSIGFVELVFATLGLII